jgi:diguanylate cyclase (GGDEF)-like protein
MLDNTKEEGTVARFGGEEFCILLPNSSPQEAVQPAENIRQVNENSRFESLAVICSFGVASLNLEDETIMSLIEPADMALYQSKYLGDPVNNSV